MESRTPLEKIATPMTNVNKKKTRKMALFSRLWMRAIQIKNGKGEGMIFFRDPHISRTWYFRDPHITRGFWYPYIPKIAFSGPSHTKNRNFTTPTYKKCHFRDPHTKDYARALNMDQQKIEAMQNTVCILEIHINTKAIQNRNKIEINFL